MTVIASDLCLSSWRFHSSFWLLASLMKPEVSKKHGVEVPAPGAVSINQSCTFFFLSFCLLKGTLKKNTLFQIGAMVKFVQSLVKIEREIRHASEVETAPRRPGCDCGLWSTFVLAPSSGG